MATVPAIPLLSADDYLNRSFEHDVEFVDGLLVERGMPTPAHSLLQAIVVEHLRQHRKALGYGVFPECRVELIKRSRYRIPDVLIAGVPLPTGPVLTEAPLAVVEIWSPDDRIGPQLARFREYWARGVRNVVILHPEDFIALRYENGALIEGALKHLHMEDGRKIPFDSDAMLAELREELSRI